MHAVVPTRVQALHGAIRTVLTTVLLLYNRVGQAIPVVVAQLLIIVEVPISLRAAINPSHVRTVTMTIRAALTIPLPVAAAGLLSRREEVPVRRVAMVPAVPVAEVVDQAAEDKRACCGKSFLDANNKG